MPQYTYIRFVQITIITIVKYCLLATKRLRITRLLPENFDTSSQYVIASNHASYGDPLALWAAFNLRQLRTITPVKVMTSRGVYFGLLRPFVWSLGAFPAKPRLRQNDLSGIEGALHYISKDYSLGIFPEGGRSLQSQNKSYPGISSVLKEYPDSHLVLVHLLWGTQPWWRRTIEIRAMLADSSVDTTNAAKIMEAIYKV